MKKDIQIKVNTETNQVLINSEILGISSENLQGNIIFKPEPFINGTCRLYVEGLGVIEMDKQEDCYTLPIKSSLLKSPGIDICFKIIEPTNEEGTPIFATKIIHLKVVDTIEDDSEIPEQYPTWIETFDSKIAEIDNKLDEVDSAISNIQDLTSEYNQNAVNKTNDFNTNATNQTSTFDNHVTSKTEEFDADTDDIVGTKKAELDDYEETKENELDTYTNSLKNDLDTYESSKETELNSYTTTKKTELDTHTNNKKTELNTYEQSKETELDTYANGLKDTFNANATTKTSEYDQNASDKTDDFDDNASAKTTAFNDNATAKIAEYDAHVSELQSQIDDLTTLVETELESNSVEGTEIDVSDSAEYRVRIEVKGNTEQEQLSGKNLFGISDYEKTYNGVQIKIKDGEITLNGTCTGTGTVYIGPKDEQILNGTYTISRNSISGTMSGSGNVNLRNVSDDSIISGTQMSLSINSRTFTLENANVEYGIYLMKDATFDNYKFRPQLVEGDTPDYDFEPYCGGQAAPNPDYPQEIKVVTGDNVVKHVGKNLFASAVEQGAYSSDGSRFNSTIQIRTSDFIRIKPNTSYIFSNTNNLVIDRICYYDENLNFIERGEYLNSSTFTTLNNNCKYIRFNIKKDGGVSNVIVPSDLINPQIEQGSTSTLTQYEQYRGEEYKLDLWKENEFDSENANVIDALLVSSNLILTANSHERTVVVPCLKNTTYKISKTAGQRLRIAEFDENPQIGSKGRNFKINDQGNKLLYSTTGNYLAIGFYFTDVDGTKCTVEEMLNSIQIQEAIELCQIGDYKDMPFKNEVGDENYNAELEEGAWYKKKAINKIKLNYSDFTNIQSINPNGYVNFRFSNLNVNDWSQDNLARAKSLCNFSIYDNTGIANVNKEGFMLADGKTLYLRISQNRFSTVERLEEFLDENDLYFYYIMKNIAYEKITDPTLISQLEALSKARWFKGVNHWWTETENLEPVLKGTYKQSNNLRLQALENIILNQSTVQSVNTIASANISNKSVPTKQITEELEDTTAELENTTTNVSEESEVE